MSNHQAPPFSRWGYKTPRKKTKVPQEGQQYLASAQRIRDIKLEAYPSEDTQLELRGRSQLSTFMYSYRAYGGGRGVRCQRTIFKCWFLNVDRHLSRIRAHPIYLTIPIICVHQPYTLYRYIINTCSMHKFTLILCVITHLQRFSDDEVYAGWQRTVAPCHGSRITSVRRRCRSRSIGVPFFVGGVL